MTGTALARIDRISHAIDVRRADIEGHLGMAVKFERFKHTTLEAFRREPKLHDCDEKSAFEAIMRAANDRCPVDGQFAAIVPFFDSKTKKLTAQYMRMRAGDLRVLGEHANVGTITVEIIYEAHYKLLDASGEPYYRAELSPDLKVILKKLPLGTPTGKKLGVACIMRDKKTQQIVGFDEMSVADVERIRNMSRAKNSPAWSGHWDEMAKKTVIRRCAKTVTTLSEEGRRAMERDDDYIDVEATPVTDTTAPVRTLNDAPIDELPALSMDDVAPDAPGEDPFATEEAADLPSRFSAALATCKSDVEMQAVQERFKAEFDKLAPDAPEKKAAAASWNARRKFLAARQPETADA